jgi:hypothetical protein
MTRRAYDPEFEAILPALSTVMDLSSAEKVQAARAGGLELFLKAPRIGAPFRTDLGALHPRE